MMKSGTVSKLVELRDKTDRELLFLVEREVNRALAMANVATTRDSPLYIEAARAYENVTKLLPTISDRSPDRRALLETTLKELHIALDSAPLQRNHVACSPACNSAI